MDLPARLLPVGVQKEDGGGDGDDINGVQHVSPIVSAWEEEEKK